MCFEQNQTTHKPDENDIEQECFGYIYFEADVDVTNEYD